MDLSPAAIKAAREARGLTQEEFAMRLGVSMRIVTAWEAGKHKPSGVNQAKLEGFLAKARPALKPTAEQVLQSVNNRDLLEELESRLGRLEQLEELDAGKTPPRLGSRYRWRTADASTADRTETHPTTERGDEAEK